ncbi:MAG: hypothetical protein GXO31_08320 [Epsilonproteobacteria bacterium]|nr:hypothetical protein [Campylobacterota bacterium]
MIDYFNKNKTAFLESIFITVVFFGVGYLIRSDDPAFLRSEIGLYIFVLAVLTLFYGWVGFITFLFMYGIFLLNFYKPFPTVDFLESTALGLLLFFFHFVWDREIKKSRAKEEYLNQKLSENSIAFYTLKASYDKLERSFLTKPFSLKDSLWKVMLFIKEPKVAKEEFLKFLRENYFVEKAFIFEGVSANRDLLVREAAKKRVPVYIDPLSAPKGGFMAVVPVFIGDRSYFLAIEKIYFSFFDKEVLLEVAVIFTYFIQTLEKERFMSVKGCNKSYLSKEFAYELCKLKEIYKKYRVTSSILTFKSSDFIYMKNLYLKIKSQKRVIDLVQALRVKKSEYLIIVMLPFSNSKEAEGFLKRLKKDDNLNSLEYRVQDLKTYRLENLLR